MNKEQYLKQRNALLKDSQGFISEGKVEEANAKMKEIDQLDQKWEETKLANANMNALKDKTKGIDFENKSVVVKEEKVVDSIVENKVVDESTVYKVAWAKVMQGKKLEGNEQDVFNSINSAFNNAYTHDTGNTSILIPETVAAGIFKRAEEMYPLYADAKKFAVTGKLSIKKHVSLDAGDAAWYAEDTGTADEQNTFGDLVLSGCDLSKSVTISWKLKSMAMAEFIPYIINELGERCGVALGYSATSGKGSSAIPPEPEGIETSLLAEVGTPQIVTYDPDHATVPVPLTYAMITSAIAKIHSSYLNGCAFYASNSTIWDQIANLMDVQGRPLFIPDVTSGGVGRMFGMVVKPDASVTGKSIIIGGAGQGLVFNTNEPMSIVTEDHAKARTTDYVAYSIVDGGVLDTKAFALIQDIPTV